jgi:hypothetical protein
VKLVWFAQYSDGEIPHATTDKGSFWWRDILKLCDLFRGIANCKIGDGSTVLFCLISGMTMLCKLSSLGLTLSPDTRGF